MWRFQPQDDKCYDCDQNVLPGEAQDIINAGEPHNPVWKRRHATCKANAQLTAGRQTQELPRCPNCHYLLIGDHCTNDKCPVSLTDTEPALHNTK